MKPAPPTVHSPTALGARVADIASIGIETLKKIAAGTPDPATLAKAALARMETIAS